MIRNCSLILVIILSVTKYCEPTLTDTKRSIIESVNEKLNIKHICIIKDDDFFIDQEIISFAKKNFNRKIFMSFMSLAEMNVSMTNYYKVPLEYYFSVNREKRVSLERMRDGWVYPPKTIVMPYGEKMKFSIGKLFTVEENGLVVSKYTWLVLDDDNTFDVVKNYDDYIPFNCQFLIVKNIMGEGIDYDIEEIYHPSIETYELFVRHFGNWNEAEGLTVLEPDFYKRRLDMNGTIIGAKFGIQYESFMDTNMEIAKMISEIMNIRWEYILPDTNQYWELDLVFIPLSPRKIVPFYIGPFWKETTHFYLAYDKKYEQYGISPLLKPFSFNLWMAVLAWLILSAISMTIIWKKINKSLKSKLSSRILISDCIYEPFDSILNQVGGKMSTESPLKIVSMTTRILALALAPLYTGAIASFILIPIIKLPFTNPKEFVQDGSYKAGFVQITGLNNTLTESNDHSIQEMARNFLVPTSGSLDEALDEVIKKMCDNHGFAFIHPFSTTWEKRFKCKVMRINLPVTFGWAVMALNYESPYQAIFNRILREIRSTGLFQFLGTRSGKKGGRVFTMIERNNDDNEVYITSLAPVFALIGVLYAFSALILFGEIIRFYNAKPK